MQNGIYFCTFVLVQGQVNRNFQLVMNEMGPGWTSRAWYFHSPAPAVIGVIYFVPSWESMYR